MWYALFILIKVHKSGSPGTEAVVHSLDSELSWKSEVKKLIE